MATQTPKDVLKFAKDNKVEAVDLKFLDLLGIWQHITIPTERARARSSSRRASASTARRSAAGSRSTRPTCS